jgi:hypothetical protein
MYVSAVAPSANNVPADLWVNLVETIFLTVVT